MNAGGIGLSDLFCAQQFRPVIMKSFPEYKNLDLPNLAETVRQAWEAERTFERSVEEREGAEPFVFYEGPPSANGMPGIHHVMARAIKDIFCRFKTQQGYQVKRKAGWDTHGLPVELSVEKELGITKEDIGKTISIADYNKKCRENVMKYTDVWNDLTRKIGYWVDLGDPYITYENKYIESVWYLLKRLYDKDLLYKGYTIQPYSPAAGTGLSSHELNQPGTYKDVKDTTVTAQFKVVQNADSEWLFEGENHDLFFLAWTTTPWTLPSNTALGVGAKIEYHKVRTFNPYTHQPISVVVAKALLGKYFPEKNADLALADYQPGQKQIPFEVVSAFTGAQLEGLRYEQLLPYAQPTNGDAFKVLLGDFVTTEDGTGIVHLAPSFGGDDFKTAQKYGIGSLTLVDFQGRFTEEVTDMAGEYVKEQYLDVSEKPEGYESVDLRIAVKLKQSNRAFQVKKYEHSYPHCWRTDKPVLYYPLDSWFVRSTAAKDRLIELNQTINWKPASTGTKRFGNWLENLQDWNLSRSRYWGIPIPIWTTEDGSEQLCVGSMEELKAACEKAVAAGVMDTNPLAKFVLGDFSETNYNTFDLHRPYVDDIVLVSASGKPMKRELDLIDVWFDSGSMPYAQWHYPFENKEIFEKNYPADFIAEGVDQTRGWFFTLHAIATMAFDSVAYKNVVSNGLVLDAKGQKMSKRLGNAVDPFETVDQYGADAVRWYMITNAQPWDNLKFDHEGITEVQRKFFRALSNTYSFFALYANIDGFSFKEAEIPMEKRPELDRWIISKLNSLIKEVTESYESYEPTRAGRAIQEFVVENLSNWFVRLSRRRFWKGDYSEEKIVAYQTLYTCLETLARLSAPIAPFYSDRLFRDLNDVSGRSKSDSVHLAEFSTANDNLIDEDLEQRMELAQRFSSMVLSLRKKENLRVRQPLQKIMVPVLNEVFRKQLAAVEGLILSETNVKELEYLEDTAGVLVKTIKPNFKALGPRYGKHMKNIAKAIGQFGQEDIAAFEANGGVTLALEGASIQLETGDVDIASQDIPGWLVATDNGLTVALDITLSEALREEGIAREFVNRIQNLRKDRDFEVTDRIKIEIEKQEFLVPAINHNLSYICSETLAATLDLVDKIDLSEPLSVEIEDGVQTKIAIEKVD